MTTPEALKLARDALKPCPFCGSDDIDVADMGGDMGGDYYVLCHGCALEAPFHASRAEAIAAWNRRTPPAGMVLVPVEPTEAMLTAGLKRKALALWKDGASPLRASTANLRPTQEVAALQWAAMIAAAQQGQQEGGNG